MRIEGRYFDGASSRRHAAVAQLEAGVLQVRDAAGVPLREPVALAALSISSRVGNTPRFLRMADGACFECDDNDAVDALGASLGQPANRAHRIESRLRYVLLGLLVAVLFVWGGVQWGVPALARVAAFALPADVNEQADRIVLQLLDRQLLGPSALPQAEQERLQAVFAPMLQSASGPHAQQVRFRDAQKTLGANALALPAGTIVFTDQLVQLAAHDEELLAVLAHEIGHVVNRHAMRRSIQATAMGLVAALVVGDVSSVSSAITALPLILTELGYSRAFEREADAYAVEALGRHGIAPQRLADVLQRLDPDRNEGVGGYLATHPPTPERVRAILAR